MRRTVIFALLLNLPPVLGLVAWPFVAMMSATIFDSGAGWMTWLFALAISTYPVPTLAGVILVYRDLKAGEAKRCYTWSVLSWSGTAFILLMLLIINLFCQGRFNC